MDDSICVFPEHILLTSFSLLSCFTNVRCFFHYLNLLWGLLWFWKRRQVSFLPCVLFFGSMAFFWLRLSGQKFGLDFVAFDASSCFEFVILVGC